MPSKTNGRANYFLTFSHNIFFCFSSSCSIGRIEFTKQPPSNLRKSNFFHFMLQLFDRNGNLVEIERTSFIKFIDEDDVSIQKAIKARGKSFATFSANSDF